VKYIGRVHCLEGTESLVDEVLAMIVREVLSADDSVHVRFHELLYQSQYVSGKKTFQKTHLNQIDFGEALEVSWLLDVQNGDDVFMVEVS
jgi:hypothetical protein